MTLTVSIYLFELRIKSNFNAIDGKCKYSEQLLREMWYCGVTVCMAQSVIQSIHYHAMCIVRLREVVLRNNRGTTALALALAVWRWHT